MCGRQGMFNTEQRPLIGVEHDGRAGCRVTMPELAEGRTRYRGSGALGA